MSFDRLNPVELGKRVAAARRARSISQENVAERLGVSRPTYLAMEKGTRPFKANDIITLSELLGRSVHDLVSDRKPITDFAPQFRVTESAQVAPAAVAEAVEDFKQVCDDYLWLEDLLNAPMPRYHPVDEYRISRAGAQTAAEDIAFLERSRLNLGQGPILNLREVLEAELGLRVFVLPLKDFRIAGMFIYTDNLGGCILVNGQHPPTRQVWSVAHEYAHFLTNRYRTEVTVLIDYERKPRSEQFADFFAASFLMPSTGLRQRFNGIVESRPDFDFTVADLCALADQYGVSVEAMTRRLEHLKCIRPNTWDKLSQSGFEGRRGQTHLNIPARSATRLHLPGRYCRLAVQAFEDERITEGTLARLLRCSRVEAREVVEALTRSNEVNMSTGAPYELDLNIGATIDLASMERN